MQMNKDSLRQGIAASTLLLGLYWLLWLTACAEQRLLYDASGIQVGIVTDLSVDMDAAPPVINRHPVTYTPQEIRSIIGSLQVSGWSGMFLDSFQTPQPKPVFTEAELTALAEPLAAAFHAATLRDRVFFILRIRSHAMRQTERPGAYFFEMTTYMW